MIANIIYTIDLPPAGDLTLSGTVTTDGNTGIITRTDVLDWDLTVSSASLSTSYEFRPFNSTLRFDSNGGGSPSAAVATATDLLFLNITSVFDLESAGKCSTIFPCGQAVVPGNGVEYFRVCNAAGACDAAEIGFFVGTLLADNGVAVGNDNDQGDNNQGNENDQGVTPLPTALPLFATGLGGLGLLRWRRKRKAQAV